MVVQTKQSSTKGIVIKECDAIALEGEFLRELIWKLNLFIYFFKLNLKA